MIVFIQGGDFPRLRSLASIHRHRVDERSGFKKSWRIIMKALILAVAVASALATPIAAFAQQTYQQLATRESFFPERFARMFPYMRNQDWLYHYRYKEGIFNSFAGLARRAAYMPPPEQACELFEAHYRELEACYQEFFPLLRDFAVRTMEDLPIR